MRVIDAAPQWWFLLEENGSLFLDASCNHSFVGYSYMIELNADERDQYLREGREFLNQLATSIQDSAPILEVSTSRFKGRDVTRVYADQMARAIDAWQR